MASLRHERDSDGGQLVRDTVLFCAAFSACGSSGSNDVNDSVGPGQQLQPVIGSKDSQLTLVAGNIGGPGSIDGTGAAARFYSPQAVAADTVGNVYVADTNNHTIRKITAAGVVSTIAGVANQHGIVLGALPGSLSSPLGVTLVGNTALAITSGFSVLALR